MGVCNCSMFCCTFLYVHSSIAIILMGKRELIALLNLSSWCLVMVERYFLIILTYYFLIHFNIIEAVLKKGSPQKPVLVHFNNIETYIWKIVTRICNIKFSWQRIITVLHTCVLIMLKCISKQIRLKYTLYHPKCP